MTGIIKIIMKNLKSLMVAVAAIIAQGVMAVTLPSTSYTPYGGDNEYVYESTETSGSMYEEHYYALGEGAYEECTSKDFAGCTSCCGDLVLACYQSGKGMAECEKISTDCNNECGRSLPLSAPLWFALLLPLVAGALKPLLRRK